ncbi:antA/AntB antirepressor family protein [Pasteurella multocida]|uniref:antA/AntB antirepressor family protein n=7 Tax=Pasteurella multocida TaxID=747 RepID=UPI002091EEDB|nr:antA/AntB antirepressor family protein [Pasteurella multocida]MCO5921208.1 antA/AntB antirepressor family protein [Pasteurella multocida]
MTNSNLIPVFNGTIQNTQIQLCNARELHAFVESKREYATWIKDRITDYGFIENEDYIIVTERTNGRPRKEYHITLDMGKELGMVERNEKGRQIRKHFIEIEKRAKQPQQLTLPEPDYNLTAIQNSEETLALIIQLYSYCFQAHEMQEKLQNTSIAKLMENQIGGQYLYNFKHPLEQVMAKAKKYVHANTERLALVKAVNNLLN